MSHAFELGPQDTGADLEVARSVLSQVELHISAGHLDCSRDAVSTWTVGQQLMHVCLVASSLATAVNRLLHEGGDEAASREATRALLASGSIPRGTAEAPAKMIREEPPLEEDVRAALDKARSRWDALADQRRPIDEAEGTIGHFDLGPLSAREWVRFAAVHGHHHLDIVADILATG